MLIYQRVDIHHSMGHFLVESGKTSTDSSIPAGVRKGQQLQLRLHLPNCGFMMPKIREVTVFGCEGPMVPSTKRVVFHNHIISPRHWIPDTISKRSNICCYDPPQVPSANEEMKELQRQECEQVLLQTKKRLEDMARQKAIDEERKVRLQMMGFWQGGEAFGHTYISVSISISI